MKGIVGLFVVLVVATANVPADERRVEIIIGPRVGVTYIAANPDEFNESVQRRFLDENREYFPFITQFGANIEQHILLGTTQSHFAYIFLPSSISVCVQGAR